MSSPRPELISALENELQRSLRPVQPNPEFVNKLHSRLVAPTTTILESRVSQSLATPILVLVGFGLAIGLFVIWVVPQIR
jgi:hypothetical protein